MKRMLWCVLTILAGTAGGAAGQEGPAGGPMTYALARKANYVPLETLRETRWRIPAPLARRVSIEREGALLQQVLLDIANQAELGLSYGEDLVRARVVVSLTVKNEAAADVLQQVTVGTDWAVLVTPAGQVAVLRREPAQVGTIAGSVTDAKAGNPLGGATVVVEGTSLSTTTGSDGRYRIGNVPPGTYTVRARYIGYAPGAASVTVSADQEATADIPLERSVQRLDEVVTTGTFVPTEVKALPTPVSVISGNDIAAQRPHTVQEVIRQAVPTAVAWDFPTGPNQTTISVRGATTFFPGGGQMKVFVDGVEASLNSQAGVDPTSIERIEVIRGPQAAAIYGSDAIGGVIQIFSKRGDPNLTRPQVSAEAALGIVQTPYNGVDRVLRQSYRGSVRGSGPAMNYNFGAAYSHTGDWLPNGELSAQSNPSVYGGMRFARGMLAIDLSGRYFVNEIPSVFNPELAGTGYPVYSKPFHRPTQVQNSTLGSTLTLTPISWLRSRVTVGLDRFTLDMAQSGRRLTSPGDTLLQIINQAQSKNSVGFNTSIYGTLSPSLGGSLTVGFDHYTLPYTQIFTVGALNTTGAIEVAPGQPLSVSRTITHNTGYFAQAQVSYRDALFLTGGLRAEENTNFGDSLGTPLSPRVGISYAQEVAGASFKIRGSWGRAIRAPTPGLKFGTVQPTSVTLANLNLGPERQKGWDVGADVVFGSRGSFSATYYDQIAEDLIDLTLVEPGSPPTFQNQNVGRVKNTGVELEGTLYVGPVQLKAQYGYVRSRLEQLPPNYGGDLRVGDQSRLTPKHTAGASLTVTPDWGTTVAAGLTYTGSWSYYDWLAVFGCFGGASPCRPTFRDYVVEYPDFLKLNARVSQQITPFLSGFVSVDNLTNNQAYEFDNISPVMGRITTIGFGFQY